MRPPTNRLERILGYGRFASGKSSMWMTIAQEGAMLHVLDSDNAWDAMRYDEVEVNVGAEHVTDYRQAVAWASKTKEMVDRNDWVVVDRADKLWLWAQEHYWGQKTGDDEFLLGDAYLRNQTGEESMAGAHGSNWGVIYKYYHGLLNLILNMPCHVLAVAAAKEIRDDTKPNVVAQYKGVGHYPAGPPNENELSHNFHTVLYCAETPRGWVYTTIKEMGPIGRPKRAMLLGEDVTDSGFVMSYLYGVAGWKP